MVHDNVAECEESCGFERLRKEVSDVRVSPNERDLKSHVFYTLSHKEVPSLDMLHAIVMLGIV